MFWENPPGNKHIERNGKAYERKDWSDSRAEMKKEAEELSTGFLAIDDYKILKKDGKYILYTR